MRAIKPQIIEALKKLGYNQRQVSIKEDGYSFNLTVRDPKVNMEAVEQAVKGLESISYDEATQEILSGGNTFIFVRMSDEVRAKWSLENIEVVEKAVTELAELKEGRGIVINENYSLYKDQCGWMSAYYSGCNGSSERVAYDTKSAQGIALQMHLHGQRLAIQTSK